MALTDEEIFAAADELEAKGIVPTQAEVRKELGGGSYTTISNALRGWRARARNQAATALPERLQQELSNAANELWTTAQRLAEAAWNAEREEFLRAQVDLEREQVEAAELASQATTEVDELAACLAEAEGKLLRAGEAQTDLNRQLQELRHSHALAAARFTDLEKHVADLNGELARVNGLNVQLVVAIGSRGVAVHPS